MLGSRRRRPSLSALRLGRPSRLRRWASDRRRRRPLRWWWSRCRLRLLTRQQDTPLLLFDDDRVGAPMRKALADRVAAPDCSASDARVFFGGTEIVYLRRCCCYRSINLLPAGVAALETRRCRSAIALLLFASKRACRAPPARCSTSSLGRPAMTCCMYHICSRPMPNPIGSAIKLRWSELPLPASLGAARRRSYAFRPAIRPPHG